MRYYRVIVMVLVFVLAYGIACLAAVEECNYCDHAACGGEDTLNDDWCNESHEVGAKHYESAIKGKCKTSTTKDCEEDTAIKPVTCDEYECKSISPAEWQLTGEDQTVDTDDCTDSTRS